MGVVKNYEHRYTTAGLSRYAVREAKIAYGELKLWRSLRSPLPVLTKTYLLSSRACFTFVMVVLNYIETLVPQQRLADGFMQTVSFTYRNLI